jgi:general secretion pathway protein N
MTRWGLVAIALGAYTLAAASMAPATLLDAGLQRASDGRLRLTEAQGTVWSGSGQIEARDPHGRTGVGKRLAWRVVPESFLRGHLVCEVGLEQAATRVPVTISLSRIELSNADIRLPATVLGFGVPKLAPLGLFGDLHIHVASVSISRGGVEGNASVQWLAAGSTLAPVSPLGDYEVRLDSEGKTVNASLRTLQGPLVLDGRGSWVQGHRPAFLAMASVPPQHRQELVPLLRLIAVERGEGRFELQLN